jgi:hypothetical protein
MKSFSRRRGTLRKPLLAAIAAATCGAGWAQTGTGATPGAPSIKISGGVSYGIGVRTSDPDPALLYSNNATAVGLSSTNPAGRNQDDGNLNYRKGDVFANVVTGFVDLTANQGAFSGLVRVQGWHDWELDSGAVPFGNSVNGYAANQPLSDAEARPRGKFSNIILSEAWVRGRFAPGGLPLTLTAGNQTLGWRGQGMAPGPMSVLDPIDLVALTRPGSFPEQRGIPIPALRATLQPRDDLSLDGFIQFGFRSNQTPVCGTFFSVLDAIGEDGCTTTMLGGPSTLSDAGQLASQRVILQRDTLSPGGSGQFGVQARWNASKTTEFGFAAARYHSRIGYFNVVKSTIPGSNPFVPGDARNPAFELEYPKGIEIFALDFKHVLDVTTLYGSVGYSPNRPLGYPIGEVSQAFASPIAVVNLFRAQERATLPGDVFAAWDRRHVSEWQLGGIHPMKGALGASSLVLRGELNARYVHDLPDPTVLRYQRPDVFGVGPVNGGCAAGASAVSCSNDGYVTRWAWGYQLAAVATYPNAIGYVGLRPRVAFAHSVKGYSYDGLLREGRKIVQLGIDALVGQATVSLGLVRNVGGGSTYDNARDRNYATAAVSLRF